MAGYLLDTCAALWSTRPSTFLAPQAREALNKASDEGLGVFVSPITAWEVGQLVARGRYALDRHPLHWFDALLEAGVQSTALGADVLVAASFLPVSETLRDPADRILAATARALSLTLVTRDRPLLDYGRAGHIRVLAC